MTLILRNQEARTRLLGKSCDQASSHDLHVNTSEGVPGSLEEKVHLRNSEKLGKAIW
jgi:hypothetical protein